MRSVTSRDTTQVTRERGGVGWGGRSSFAISSAPPTYPTPPPPTPSQEATLRGEVGCEGEEREGRGSEGEEEEEEKGGGHWERGKEEEGEGKGRNGRKEREYLKEGTPYVHITFPYSIIKSTYL